jgi:hypothetical protein
MNPTPSVSVGNPPVSGQGLSSEARRKIDRLFASLRTKIDRLELETGQLIRESDQKIQLLYPQAVARGHLLAQENRKWRRIAADLNERNASLAAENIMWREAALKLHGEVMTEYLSSEITRQIHESKAKQRVNEKPPNLGNVKLDSANQEVATVWRNVLEFTHGAVVARNMEELVSAQMTMNKLAKP